MDDISKLDKFFIATPMNNGSFLEFGDIKLIISGDTLELNIKDEYRYFSPKEIEELSNFLCDCKEHFRKKKPIKKEMKKPISKATPTKTIPNIIQKTRVVDLNKERHDVYIGRKVAKFHYGNPFTHKFSAIAEVVVPTRKEAVNAFRNWIRGLEYQDVEPERRQWILDNLYNLKGKILGCYCYPKLCHGNIYIELIENKISENLLK